MEEKLAMNWLFIDLETTGLQPTQNHIIEIAAIRRDYNDQCRQYQSLVNPGYSIDSFVQRLTGITDKMVSDAPKIADIKNEILDLLEGAFIVAHNASFDVSFLETNLDIKIERKYVIDTIELAKILFPNLNSYSLKNLIRKFNLDVQPCHRAMADTQALDQLFYYLLNYAKSLHYKVIAKIAEILQDQDRGLFQLFYQLMLSNKGEINTWLSTDWNMSEESNISKVKNDTTWQPEEIEAIFMPGGILSQSMNNYQDRSGQIEMLKSVTKALTNSRCLMVEAGTGVGKSLAYLIPALKWAISKKETVVVATHTIALQEQLYHKEIDFLHSILPINFNCALLKGRNNYLCLSRWQQVLEQGKNLIWGEKVLLARLHVWLENSTSGDLDSIHLLGPEREWFAQMASSRETCQGILCPNYRACFYQKARHKAVSADLIIVNHSLLLADAKLGEAVLPKYSYLIIDEAHHIEEEGTRQFTESFSLFDFEKKVQMLHKRRDVFGRPGFLQYLKDWRKQGIGSIEKLEPILEELENWVKHTLKRIKALQSYLLNNSSPDMLRISQKNITDSWWQSTYKLLDNLCVVSLSLIDVIKKLVNLLQGEAGKIFDESWLNTQLQHLASVKEEVQRLQSFLQGTTHNDSEQIYWLKRDNRKNDLILCLTPLNTAKCFQDFLFNTKEAVILTSATLSVNGNFNYFREQLGIKEEWLDTKFLESPFDYRNQVLLLTDNQLPNPALTSETVYNMALQESLAQILEACHGRSLVLFTSHRQLKAMYDSIFEYLQARGLELYADGINGNRNTLIEELKTNEKAIVFGANTFWEGVDLPGLALTSLIIVRLPFSPPNQPLTEARMESLQAQGQDPFFNYSLPQAVLRFKQGYGRLIRSSEDWGVVVVLDNRIINKRYGKIFLKSLPDSQCVAGKAEQLVELIHKWQKRFL